MIARATAAPRRFLPAGSRISDLSDFRQDDPARIIPQNAPSEKEAASAPPSPAFVTIRRPALFLSAQPCHTVVLEGGALVLHADPKAA
jgi:hypothetical protein